MHKHISPGLVKVGDRPARFYCTVKYDGTSLSITGVVGPLANGNALGSCGQSIMSFKEYDEHGHMTLAEIDSSGSEFWTADNVKRFFDIWDRWHMNDARPNCQHQTGPFWDTRKKLTLYYFRINKAVRESIRATEKKAVDCIKEGKGFYPTKEQTFLANLEDRRTYHLPELPADIAPYYEPNGPQYSGDHYNRASETKTAGLVKESEHPEGLLSKMCPVCCYRYGTAWKKEDVPADVIAFLESIPERPGMPACWARS